MNVNILSKICAYVGIKNRKKLIKINQKFYEVCCSNVYLISLRERDKYLVFLRCCKLGRPKTVKTLLPYVDPTILDNRAIIDACEKGCAEVVKILLEDGRIDPCVEANKAIDMACTNGHLNILRLLVDDTRVMMNFKGGRQNLLCIASANGHLEVIKLLYRRDMIYNSPHLSYDDSIKYALCCACSRGHYRVVKFLLKLYKLDYSTIKANLVSNTASGNHKLLIFIQNYPKIDLETWLKINLE